MRAALLMLPLLQGVTARFEPVKCAKALSHHTAGEKPVCPNASAIPGLYPIAPVMPQPSYSYDTCMEFYDQMPAAERRKVSTAEDWCDGGSYFVFKSGAGKNVEISGGGVKMWWRCDGSRDSPQVLFVHGYPTSSYDTWLGTSNVLKNDHYVCHVDHQGMGFSDKPQAPYYYSIYEHAAALNYFVTSVANLTSFHMVTHDMGDSIGFAFLRKFVNPATAIAPPNFNLTHHTFTNGNVWLPLSNLTTLQLGLLDNHTSPDVERYCMSPEFYAYGIESLLRPVGNDPSAHADHASLVSVFAYKNGTGNQDDVNQYLQQRACWEAEWLEGLNTSTIPATLVWGQSDSVCPAAVGDFMWDDALSKRNTAPARYIKSPSGGHYIPTDQPELFACLIRDPRGDCTQYGSYQAGSTYPK